MAEQKALLQRFVEKYIYRPGTSIQNRDLDPAHFSNSFLSSFLQRHEHAGVNVTIGSAYGLTAVFSAVKAISEAISTLPLNVFTRDGNNKTINQVHPAQFLIHSEPNKNMTAVVFWEKMLTSFLLWGNAYAWIIRDGGARPIEIRFIPPNLVEPVLFENLVFYKVTGIRDFVSAEDILHIPDVTIDGIKGLSRVDVCAKSLGINIATEDYSADLYADGVNLNGIMITPYKDPGKENLDHLSTSWDSKYTGSNSKKTAFLPKDFDYKPIGIPPDQAQFIETKKFGLEEVARIFRVPLAILMNIDNGSFANTEQQNLSFVTNTIRPLLKKFEQEINKKLIRESEKGKVFVKFNIDALLRGDKKTQAAYYKTGLTHGFLTINQVKSMENLNGIGADGDETFVQMNMQPIKEALKPE